MSVVRIDSRPTRLVIDDGPVLRVGGLTLIDVDGDVTVVEPGGAGATVHADLTGRDAADSHPISAVTGLATALAAKVESSFALSGGLSGTLASPGLNDSTVRGLAGAMFTGNAEIGITATHNTGTGKIDLVAEVTQADLDARNNPHTVGGFVLVAPDFDPTVTPTLHPTGAAPLYLYTGTPNDTYAYTGLWHGNSDGVTPALMTPDGYDVGALDFYLSRLFMDATDGWVDGAPTPFTPGPGIADAVLPSAWSGSRFIIGYVSPQNGPSAPVWVLPMEFDWDDHGFAPSIDALGDVDTTTSAPSPDDVLAWDGTNWVPAAPGGSVTVDVVSNVTADRILGRLSTDGDSQELTASQVRALLNIADGAAALGSSTPAALGTAAAGAATTAAKSDHVHALPPPDHAPGIISAAKLAGGFSAGTPLFPLVSTTTVALSTGQMAVGYGNRYASSALTGLSISVTASSLSAGQTLTVVCYVLDADGYPTGTVAWSEAITVGTSTGWLSTGTISRALPYQYAIGILNPSGNAGSVTLTAAQPLHGWVVTAASANRSGLVTSSQASAPDVSAFTTDSTSTSSKWAPQQNIPIVWARRA